jgi:hypothetical protein
MFDLQPLSDQEAEELAKKAARRVTAIVAVFGLAHVLVAMASFKVSFILSMKFYFYCSCQEWKKQSQSKIYC